MALLLNLKKPISELLEELGQNSTLIEGIEIEIPNCLVISAVPSLLDL
jgi:hypothetical protein